MSNGNKLLVADTETTGLRFGHINPAGDITDSEYYQMISIGMIVSDTENLQPIDSCYVEIQWDGNSTWSHEAEEVHGLSKEYLQQHGLPIKEAAVKIAQFIVKHFDPKSPIRCAGHNFATFDLHFIRQFLGQFGVMFKHSNRIIDTSTIGTVCYNLNNSDDLFKLMGINRDGKKHNALDDAMATLITLNYTRKLMGKLTGKT